MKQNIKVYMAGFLSAFIILITIDAYAGGLEKTIDVVLNKVNLSQDGTIVTLAEQDYLLENGDAVPYSILYKSTTYLPVRKLSEILGKEVNWIGENNLVELNSPGYLRDEEIIKTLTKVSPPYDYAKPVPLSDAVDDVYFADSAFVGNSLIQGLMGFSGIQGADNLGLTSLTVFGAFTKEEYKTETGSKITVMDALALKEYKKVYLQFGINEIGTTETKFIDAYKLIIDQVRKLQPNAQIYVHSILPVTAAKSSIDKVINNTRIDRFNVLIQSMAKDKQVYFINVAEVMKGTDGALFKAASSDGVHLQADYYKIWYDYLKIHSIEAE